VLHVVKDVVKSVDKDSKTMVVKAADGTEDTIKWTDKTTMKGVKDTSKGVEEGTKVSVNYTEKAGEKTAVGVKAAGKATEKCGALIFLLSVVGLAQDVHYNFMPGWPSCAAIF
jgi:hypothetical protein